MSDWLLGHEPVVRLSAFALVFAVMAIWERVAARRAHCQSTGQRWFANLSILAVDTVLARIVFPTAAVGFAIKASENGWGLLSLFGLPWLVQVVVAFVLLDLAIYGQHVLFHAVPWLWRLHLVHHSDEELDLTSGVRFHPGEILLSVVIKFAVIAALGAPAATVLVFEVVLNATSIFNHSNVRIPRRFESALRWVLVTPDMHRVHHSVERTESNRNFGFNLPWWDRLFGTYQAQPTLGHEGMMLGVESLRQFQPRGVLNLIVMPLVSRGDREPREDGGESSAT